MEQLILAYEGHRGSTAEHWSHHCGGKKGNGAEEYRMGTRGEEEKRRKGASFSDINKQGYRILPILSLRGSMARSDCRKVFQYFVRLRCRVLHVKHFEILLRHRTCLPRRDTLYILAHELTCAPVSKLYYRSWVLLEVLTMCRVRHSIA